MATIMIKENTRIGKSILEMLKALSEADEILKKRMKENNQSDFLTKDEKENFLDELHNLSD